MGFLDAKAVFMGLETSGLEVGEGTVGCFTGGNEVGLDRGAPVEVGFGDVSGLENIPAK